MPLLALAACSTPEQELLDRYLAASQRDDNETVAALSMVAFPEPVDSWNVLRIGDAREEPYPVPALREAVELAEDERDAQFREFGAFRQANYETLRSMEARRRATPDIVFRGREGELMEEWSVYREGRRDVVADLRERELDLERELRRVTKSLQRESTPEYLTGTVLRKEAAVRVGPEEVGRHYLVTLTKYELDNQFGSRVPSRWIITDVRLEGDLAP